MFTLNAKVGTLVTESPIEFTSGSQQKYLGLGIPGVAALLTGSVAFIGFDIDPNLTFIGMIGVAAVIGSVLWFRWRKS